MFWSKIVGCLLTKALGILREVFNTMCICNELNEVLEIVTVN